MTAAILDRPSPAVAAALAGAPGRSVRVLGADELRDLGVVLPRGWGARRFRGVRSLPDLTRRVIDLGDEPPLGCLHDGWLWVDDTLVGVLTGHGSLSEAARAVVSHAAASAAHPTWTTDRVVREAPLPAPDVLAHLLPRPSASHPFRPFRDAHGRWGMRTPEWCEEPVPAAVAAVAQVVVDDGENHVVGAGTVVGVDVDVIWVVSARHFLGQAIRLAVVVGGVACPASVVDVDVEAVAAALGEERRSSLDPVAARSLDLALLRVDRGDHGGPVPPPVPPADDLIDGTPVTTIGYTSHPDLEPVVVDLFGSAAADVVVVSRGTLHVGRPQQEGPEIDFPGLGPVSARDAGGGRAVAVVDDPWPTAGSSGGPALVETDSGHALAGVVLASADIDGLGRLTALADSTSVRAVLRAAAVPLP